MKSKTRKVTDPHTAVLIGFELSKVLDQSLEEPIAPAKMLASIIRGKVSAKGIRLSAVEQTLVEEACESGFRGNWSALENLQIHRRGRGDESIELVEADVSRAIRNIQKSLPAILRKVVETCADRTFPDFAARLAKVEAQDSKEHAGFQRRLERSYRPGLLAFKRFLTASLLAGNALFLSHSEPKGLRQTPRRVALLRLHHRACRVALEVHWLLRAGYSDGAMARWRTLHELAVCAAFLQSNKAEVARRYIRHEALQRRQIDRAIAARTQGGAQAALPANPGVEFLKATYGGEYCDDYGWAAAALGAKRVTFRDLEQATGFGHVRTEYLKANSAVHASSLGLTYRPGVNQNATAGTDLDWAITSNIGLVVPATLASWSLLNVTVALLVASVTPERVVLMNHLVKLERDVRRTFARSERRIMGREATGS